MTTPIGGHKSYLTFNGLNLSSGLASDIKMSFKGKELDASTIGSDWEAFRQGQTGAEISVSGVYDTGTAAASLDAVAFANLNGGGTKLYEYGPGGSASNAILYKGNGFLTGFEMSGAVGKIQGFAATIRVADTPTHSTMT